jgi:hypothetical protein
MEYTVLRLLIEYQKFSAGGSYIQAGLSAYLEFGTQSIGIICQKKGRLSFVVLISTPFL